MNKHTIFKDYGGAPLILNLPVAAERNESFRQALWTGNDLQLTVMSIPVGGEIGAEMHENLDQMLRVESGVALIRIGESESTLRDARRVGVGSVLLIPSGTYHNLLNVGREPLCLSSVYAPPAHPKGTVHKTKEDAKE